MTVLLEYLDSVVSHALANTLRSFKSQKVHGTMVSLYLHTDFNLFQSVVYPAGVTNIALVIFLIIVYIFCISLYTYWKIKTLSKFEKYPIRLAQVMATFVSGVKRKSMINEEK